MSNIVRCAIVGLGRIGSMLEDDHLREKPCTHAGAVHADPDCVLVGGCDLDEDRCRTFAERWNCTHVYKRVEDLLGAMEPDIVCVATPPETHLHIVESVLLSNARLTICEKPLAPSSADAMRIAHYHQAGCMKIMTNHERRYSADYLRVQSHVESHTFGELLSISSRVYMGERRSALEMLLDDGTHLVDILRFLTGAELTGIHAELLETHGGETLFVHSTADGIPLYMEIGAGRDHVVFELDLSFSAGRIRIGNGLYEEYRSAGSPFYEGMNSLMPTDAQRPTSTKFFSNMLRDAVKCVLDPEAEPRSTALDGYRSIQFIDRVRELVGAREPVHFS